MRISDWSSAVCSSDLIRRRRAGRAGRSCVHLDGNAGTAAGIGRGDDRAAHEEIAEALVLRAVAGVVGQQRIERVEDFGRSEEHTSELQSLMRISYAVLCLKIKNNQHTLLQIHIQHNLN